MQETESLDVSREQLLEYMRRCKWTEISEVISIFSHRLLVPHTCYIVIYPASYLEHWQGDRQYTPGTSRPKQRARVLCHGMGHNQSVINEDMDEELCSDPDQARGAQEHQD